jgi:hypothetical protein
VHVYPAASQDGPFFITHTVAATTAYKDIYPKFLALESQGPEPLATSFWQDFDKAGCKVLRGRPMMVTADGRGMVSSRVCRWSHSRCSPNSFPYRWL